MTEEPGQVFQKATNVEKFAEKGDRKPMGRRVPERGKKPGAVRTVNQEGAIYKDFFVVGAVVVASPASWSC